MEKLTAILRKKFAVMGIVNITPDSFYDGGRYFSEEMAVSHALALIDKGADVLDIGGASSRPGASLVAIEDEIRRVVPVIDAVRKETEIPISVDTTWSSVAQAALDAGADWINDISAGYIDSTIIDVVAQRDAVIILMHSRGTPQTMQVDPHYENVITEVVADLKCAVKRCTDAGIDKNKIIIDPGIGFGKTFEHNCALLKNVRSFCELGFPVLLGTSRKSFIGTITGKRVDERMAGSLGSIASAYVNGVKLFRVHDVAETVDFLKVLSEVAG
ncbi:MAG TPA: dihydropteroate synthase [Chitinispirillaceae bacterium]|nr:dihydropteroate synthase [Chitinispirillaceae bacterium]